MVAAGYYGGCPGTHMPAEKMLNIVFQPKEEMQGPWTDFMFHTSYRTGYHVPYLTCNTGRLVCQAISESASVTMAAPMITPSHPLPTHTRLFMTHLHLVAHIWDIFTKWSIGVLEYLILSCRLSFAKNRHFLLKDVHFSIDGTQSEHY